MRERDSEEGKTEKREREREVKEEETLARQRTDSLQRDKRGQFASVMSKTSCNKLTSTRRKASDEKREREREEERRATTCTHTHTHRQTQREGSRLWKEETEELTWVTLVSEGE